jgi:tetratricopeptide (TPR) repeat protein
MRDEPHRFVRTAARIRRAGPVALAAWFALAAPVDAQEGNRDYYSARHSRDDAQLLKNVEQYHLQPAYRALHERDWRRAKGEIEFILRHYPNHPQALAFISDLCDTKWKHVTCDSKGWFERAFAVRSSPHAQTFVVYGIHLHRLQKLDDAIQAYKKGLELDPRAANGHYNLALAYFDVRDYTAANAHGQAAYSLGMQLPGIKDRLSRVGRWTPLPPEELDKLLTPQPGTG